MKSTTILPQLLVAFALQAPAFAAPVSPSVAFTVQQGSTSTQAAAILNRFEQGIPGGLTTSQRDQIRQAAESYARDRGTSQANAQKQFEGVLQTVLNPSVYNDVYLANRDYFLSGRGQRPQSGGSRTGNQEASAILTRFERGIPGDLTTTQRDQIRQAAETYARDRVTSQANAQQQFEGTLQTILNPSVYNDVYLANRDYFLSGRGQLSRTPRGGNNAGTGRGANQSTSTQAAAILNRFEQGIPGGLTTSQRDQIRQAAETYARDRGTSQANAQQQFEGTLQAVLNPSVYNDVYVANRNYFLSGQGQRPQAGTRTSSQDASAILTRFERGIPGGLTTSQRDQIRQAAETYARDRGTSQANAQKQFEGTLQTILNPSVYNDVYLARRAYFLSGQGGAPNRR
ncbi:hypothetical protein [Hymenobacter chitinivorans]|uniref:Uncharacterized protein n=1 Tax=Hymenobacter chitinivorans DSM 11115 TaxID=1121954 RepID=A0A2M9BMU0_9BACT|nr:hypothetical protein [Hymenobacter chitinivorans]PJJ59268.1 hypothetical protein CLV45_0684 [Hymenobacter chitinivorans DSM 11115]